MTWKVEKYYTIANQECFHICGQPEVCGLRLCPYAEDSLYKTFKEAEEDLIKLLSNTNDRGEYASLWTIIPIYKTNYFS